MASKSQTVTFPDLTKLINRGNQHLSRILLLFIVNPFTVSQCAPMTDIEHCWRCDDFNRQSKGQCATHYTDCGDCKQGFIQDEEDPRLCFAVEILEDPGKDIEQRAGSEVILPCIFNAKVWCAWTKNTNQVVINSDSRYQYITADAGKTKSYDCGIRIQPLSMDDIGQWQCESMADENMNSVKGRATQISIKHDEDELIPTIKFNDDNVSGSEINANDLQAVTRHRRSLIGQDNVLECQVRLTPSELRWEIDGNVIVGGKLNNRKIHLNRDDLETVETPVSEAIKLTCLVEYDSGQRYSSFVIIRNEASEIDSSDSESPEVFSNEANIYTQPIPMTILVSSVTLSLMLITFLVAVILIILKLNHFKREKRNKLMTDG